MARALTDGFGRDDIYQYAVERTLDGVAARIAALEAAGQGREGTD